MNALSQLKKLSVSMISINLGFNTPWKIRNELSRYLIYPLMRIQFAYQGIPWGNGWRFYGSPIIQKHRESFMKFGSNFQLRSSVRSNPLAPFHPVFLCTWNANAVLDIGDNFGMTGGTICAAERIIIGDNVIVGANSTIIDTDFHPIDPEKRKLHPDQGKTSPIVIEDDVFVGMNVLILKGVRIGYGSVVGAGSVVTCDVPPRTIVAGNPARSIGSL